MPIIRLRLLPVSTQKAVGQRSVMGACHILPCPHCIKEPHINPADQGQLLLPKWYFPLQLPVHRVQLP